MKPAVPILVVLTSAGCVRATSPSTVGTGRVMAARVLTASQGRSPDVAPDAVVLPPNPYPDSDVPAAAPTPEAPAPTAAVMVSDTATRRFRGQLEDTLLQAMATRPVLRVIERFNSSTLVFHCDLGDGIEMAFKPAREGEHDWWRHEIVGYRLARAMGLTDRVPPAVYRQVPIRALEGHLHDANLQVDDHGMVEGVAIVWMPVLHHSGLHTPEARAEWSQWLDPRREIPAAHRRRALQIATLIAFDYLQANFDRWNSANVPTDEHDDIVFRDNNRGWYVENLRRMSRGGLHDIERVPAWLVDGVERATADVLRAELAQDPLGVERYLRHGGWRWYARRREALLRQIRHAVAHYGRDAVLLTE